MTKFWIWPYKQGSRSARALAHVLDAKVIKHRNSIFKDREWKTVINWGSESPPIRNARVLNRWVYPDKVEMFKLDLADVCVPWATDKREAGRWIKDGHTVVARHLTRAHSGRGITLHTEAPLPNVPLYTRYVKKKDEYRVHCARGGAIQVDRKARRIAHDNPNWQIRNHQNGFVYATHEVKDTPLPIINAATAMFECTGYDFGAVDVLWNEHEGKAYVCEVNAAPGLENQRTLEFYANAMRNL